jgi:hypothetical protein
VSNVELRTCRHDLGHKFYLILYSMYVTIFNPYSNILGLLIASDVEDSRHLTWALLKSTDLYPVSWYLCQEQDYFYCPDHIIVKTSKELKCLSMKMRESISGR